MTKDDAIEELNTEVTKLAESLILHYRKKISFAKLKDIFDDSIGEMALILCVTGEEE